MRAPVFREVPRPLTCCTWPYRHETGGYPFRCSFQPTRFKGRVGLLYALIVGTILNLMAKSTISLFASHRLRFASNRGLWIARGFRQQSSLAPYEPKSTSPWARSCRRGLFLAPGSEHVIGGNAARLAHHGLMSPVPYTRRSPQKPFTSAVNRPRDPYSAGGCRAGAAASRALLPFHRPQRWPRRWPGARAECAANKAANSGRS